MATRSFARGFGGLALLCALSFQTGCITEVFGDDEEWRDHDCDSEGDWWEEDPPVRPDPPQPPQDQCPDDPSTILVATERAVCDFITFSCPEGFDPFNLDCGCGCADPMPNPEPVCPDEGEGVIYVSRDLKVCTGVTFQCPENHSAFNAACGCGCVDDTLTEPEPPACPDVNDPDVHYIGDASSAVCNLVDFTCPPDCETFNNDCGCGCIENPAGGD